MELKADTELTVEERKAKMVEFEQAYNKLIEEHPGKVVWMGGCEGDMTMGWLDIPKDDLPRARQALNDLGVANQFEILIANLFQ